MAWALKFDGVNDYVTIDINHSPSSTPVWEFEFKLSSGSEVSGFYRITGASVSDSQNRILVNTSLTEFRFYRSGVAKIWTGLSFAITDVFKLVQSGTSLELFINAASQGSIAGATGIEFGVIGANFNTYSEMDLEYMRFITTDDSSLDRDYDATASSHTSGTPILSDISGNAQDGTGVNMPTDGSAWIDLGGGGISITAESGTYLYTGTNADLLLSRILTVNSGAYNYTGTSVNLARGLVLNAGAGNYTYNGTDAILTFTPVGAAVLVADSGSYSYTGAGIGFNRNRVIIAATGSYSYNGTDIQFIVPGQIWTDKPTVSTTWINQDATVTNWTNQTPTSTIWTDK